MLILGDGLCPSVLLAALTVGFFLYVDSIHRLKNAKNISELMQVPWSTVISWSIFEGLFFYGTGHQPTFNTIQWSAAFVGFSGANYGVDDGPLGINYWLPGLLVGWNTYVSRITFAFLLPLLLVAPFGIYTFLQFGLLGINHIVEEEKKMENSTDESTLEGSLEDGEAVLLSHGDEATSNMFRLCIRYSAISGFRMFAAMVASTTHRRHLMVQKIFTPRFIFEAIGFGISLVTMCLSYLTFIRIRGSVSKYVKAL